MRNLNDLGIRIRVHMAIIGWYNGNSEIRVFRPDQGQRRASTASRNGRPRNGSHDPFRLDVAGLRAGILPDGGWLAEHGRESCYFIAMDRTREDERVGILRTFLAKTQQESLYLEVQVNIEVRFVTRGPES